MNRNSQLLGISAAMHLLVDGICICSLYLLADGYGSHFGSYGDLLVLGAILTYNVLAFMSQPLTGMMADRLVHRHWLLVASVLSLTLAVACALPVLIQLSAVQSRAIRMPNEQALLLITVLLGAGNSLFHVWGGKQTVVKTGNDIRALGVFVSTGALGLAIGAVFCSLMLMCVLLLAVVALSVVYVRLDNGALTTVEDYREHCQWLTPAMAWALVVLLMLFVAYRSFAGELFSEGITKSQVLVLAIGAVAMLGKMAGGWLACYMGVIRSLAMVLTGVALCFLFKGNFLGVLLLGIFLMNCTMPVTLCLTNRLLPGREGLAFGLLAAALIPGWLMAIYL